MIDPNLYATPVMSQPEPYDLAAARAGAHGRSTTPKPEGAVRGAFLEQNGHNRLTPRQERRLRKVANRARRGMRR